MNFPNATDSLRDIIYFVTAAKTESITDAAEELGKSKSAIGKSISRLESNLGSALFHRNTRRIRLTTDGETYLKSCINALNVLYNAESELISKSLAPSGVVRIDMPAAFGRSTVMPVLLDISKRYPDLKYILTFNDKVVDPLDEGFDLAFRFGALVESADLIARPLNAQQLILCASPSYLNDYGVPDNIDELENHKCIVAWRAGKPLSWLLTLDNGLEGRYSPRAYHEISDGDAMVAACMAGAGIIQFPRSLVRNAIDKGDLVEILPQANPKETGLHIIWTRNKFLMPGVRYVIDEFLKLSNEHYFS